MAKYLGGTDSQQEEVKAELVAPGCPPPSSDIKHQSRADSVPVPAR